MFRSRRIAELEGEITALTEQLAEASAVAAQVGHLQRELRIRDRRIAFLEVEVEKARAALYEADAQAAQRHAREQRVAELLGQGCGRKQTAIDVFGYDGGYATIFVARIAEAIEATEVVATEVVAATE